MYAIIHIRWSAHKYAIELNGDQWMNLPAEYVGLSNYRATLGHFVNHSFRDGCQMAVAGFLD